MDAFLTVAEAVKFTGKSRRTVIRLANRLEQAGSDQVLREKTRGKYKWLIGKQSLQAAYGVSQPQPGAPVDQQALPPSPLPVPVAPETALEITRQGYASLMSMHHEVRQAYEKMLAEKDHRITTLNQELEVARGSKGVWSWIWRG